MWGRYPVTTIDHTHSLVRFLWSGIMTSKRSPWLKTAYSTRNGTPYRMVGNFHERFIFAFFAGQESFAKIKQQNFCCPRARQANCVSTWPTSNYLFILTATGTCQQVCLQRLSLKPSRKLKCYVSTDAQTERRRKAESGSNCFYERPGYEATFLTTLEQRAEIAISLRRQFSF